MFNEYLVVFNFAGTRNVFPCVAVWPKLYDNLTMINMINEMINFYCKYITDKLKIYAKTRIKFLKNKFTKQVRAILQAH